MTYPCSYMLYTFYRGADTNKDDALLTLKEELDSYIPKEFLEVPEGTPYHGPHPLEVMHPKERLIDLLMECHWTKERGDASRFPGNLGKPDWLSAAVEKLRPSRSTTTYS